MKLLPDKSDITVSLIANYFIQFKMYNASLFTPYLDPSIEELPPAQDLNAIKEGNTSSKIKANDNKTKDKSDKDNESNDDKDNESNDDKGNDDKGNDEGNEEEDDDADDIII